MTAPGTVADLVGLIDRAKKALCEAGRPDLAEHAHVVVLPDGEVRLSFQELNPPDRIPVVEKFLTLDPVFEYGGNPT